MAVRSPLNAFSFDIWLIEIGQEIKLLEHFKKKLDHPVYITPSLEEKKFLKSKVLVRWYGGNRHH
jgi:hypothetical protein